MAGWDDKRLAPHKASIADELALIEWPRNFGRITFDFTQTLSARYSMHYVTKMHLAAVVLFRDRCSDGLYRAICLFFRLRNEVLKTHHHTAESRGECQQLTRKLVEIVSSVLGADAVNKPNWLNLISALFKDLELVPNVHLFRTEQYERKNKSTRCRVDFSSFNSLILFGFRHQDHGARPQRAIS